MNPTLEAKLQQIPAGPGVYLYKDASTQTIYVGKAKSLRNRVRTYFQASAALDERKDQMLEAIEDVEFIVTDNNFGDLSAIKGLDFAKQISGKPVFLASSGDFSGEALPEGIAGILPKKIMEWNELQAFYAAASARAD